MAVPQLLNDIVNVLLLLAHSASVLCLVLAGISLRREGGGVSFLIGGGFTKWMFWAVLFLTLQPLLSWFISFGVGVPALDNLKTLKAIDQAGSLTLQAADELETAASQAAPGSAPFLTASAVVASIQSQAVTQKMLAAELRQEAARLAHKNALRKRGATYKGQLGKQIINLLKRQ